MCFTRSQASLAAHRADLRRGGAELTERRPACGWASWKVSKKKLGKNVEEKKLFYMFLTVFLKMFGICVLF